MLWSGLFLYKYKNEWSREYVSLLEVLSFVELGDSDDRPFWELYQMGYFLYGLSINTWLRMIV